VRDRRRSVAGLVLYMFLGGLAGLARLDGLAAQDCASQAANLLSNCGFNVSSATGWEYLNGSTAAQETTTCGTLCNANRVTGNLGIRFRQCLAGPLPAGSYGFGVKARAANVDVDSCEVRIGLFANLACPIADPPVSTFVATLDTFTQSAYDLVAATNALPGAGYASVEFRVNCPVFGGGTSTALFDDAFFGIGLTPVELLEVAIE
jgi:hypothetical protein